MKLIKKNYLLIAVLVLMISLVSANVMAENMVGNSDFSQELFDSEKVSAEEWESENYQTENNWLFVENGGSGEAVLENDRVKINITDQGVNSWAVQLIQAPIEIKAGYKYRVEFDAKASKPRDLEVKIGGTGDRGWPAYNPGNGESGGVVNELTEEFQSYDFEFVMSAETDERARFEFQMGSDDGTIWLDNVRIEEIGEADSDEMAEINKKEWVYNNDFFFIFNLAIGGNWPGYPDETTTFPQQMEVDYIKVFDQDGNLDWQDNFEGDEINKDYWTFEVGNGHEQGIPGWGNNELQYYTAGDNAWIEDDKLIIEAREEEISDEHGSYDYTSTRMVTRDKVNMEYGKVEIRAKMPAGQGIWSALWMLGSDIDTVPWPRSGEIDLMEYLGQNIDQVHGTIHGPNHSGGQGISGSYSLDEGNFRDEFHVFTFEWEEDEMRWYVDDELFHVVERTDNNEVKRGLEEEISYTEDEVVNGDFNSAIVDDMDGTPDNWYVWAGEGGAVNDYSVEDGEFKIDISSLGNQTWAVQFAQYLDLDAGDYELSFTARADQERDIIAMVQEDGGSWTVYGEQTASLGTEMKEYSFDLSLSEADIPKLVFSLGNTDNGAATTIYLDNVEIEKVN